MRLVIFQIIVWLNPGLAEFMVPCHGFVLPRFLVPALSNLGFVFSGFPVRDLPNLFCPCKTDSAWANRHSRFAMHSVAGFRRIRFYQIVVSLNPGLAEFMVPCVAI